MATQTKHITVHGRVQGVGFRYFVQQVGERLGVTGNVRNCPDSTVEIVVQGSEKKVAEFIKQVERGTAFARVQRLDVVGVPVQDVYSSFLIEGW
jgi:acylphosphatase